MTAQTPPTQGKPAKDAGKAAGDDKTPPREAFEITTKLDPQILAEIDTHMASDATLIDAGLSYVNRGVRGLEAARDTAKSLRGEYQDAIKRHRLIKVSALAAESALMAFYGYGAIEHYTGFKGSPEAIATNTALSGAISVTRAAVQYGLMKHGEEAFKDGNKTRGFVFTGAGLGLALINSLFVADGFAKKYVAEVQGEATEELSRIGEQEVEIREQMAEERGRLNEELAKLDAKLEEIRAGSGDPRIAEIEKEMARLEQANLDMNNHESFSDGRETEADRHIRRNIEKNSARITELVEQKTALLEDGGRSLSPEQQRVSDAATAQHQAISDEIAGLEEKYGTQLNALKTSAGVWQMKLQNAAGASNSSYEALKSDPTILIEAMANVAAISVANWYAAVQGHKQETIQGILSGMPDDDPWAGETTTPQKEIATGAQTFMGYDYSAGGDHHLRNEAKLASLSKILGNPEALRAEMKGEIMRRYKEMISFLHDNRDNMKDEEYNDRLSKMNITYEKSLELVNSPEILQEIELIIAKTPVPKSAEEVKIPEFQSQDDPKFQELPSGSQFRAGGKIWVKR